MTIRAIRVNEASIQHQAQHGVALGRGELGPNRSVAADSKILQVHTANATIKRLPAN